MDEQKGEERLEARGRGAQGGPAVDGQMELTEKTNLEPAGHLGERRRRTRAVVYRSPGGKETARRVR